MDELSLGDIKLIVGLNATGKTRTLNLINSFSKMLLPAENFRPIDGSYDLSFDVNGRLYRYNVTMEQSKVIAEHLYFVLNDLVDRGLIARLKKTPGARQLVCRFRDQATLSIGPGNARPGSARSRRQSSSSAFRRAPSSAAKASTPGGDQLIPWCLQRADTAQSLYFSTRVLAIPNPARCRCW